jgi:hypothetical protein
LKGSIAYSRLPVPEHEDIAKNLRFKGGKMSRLKKKAFEPIDNEEKEII